MIDEAHYRRATTRGPDAGALVELREVRRALKRALRGAVGAHGDGLQTAIEIVERRIARVTKRLFPKKRA